MAALNRKLTRITFVCLTPEVDSHEHRGVELPSYGIHRILAAVVSDPELADAESRLFDLEREDVDAYVDALSAFEPQLIGVSLFVWSARCLNKVSRRMKQRFPDCTIVFGGPSARPAVLDLAPYRKAIDYVDAVVTRDGEIIMGLPGDSPEQFRRSFYRARTFPCALRVYHCCVLPSALMVRSLAEHALDYDSITLKMRSCLGWSREAMLRKCKFLNQQAQASHGQVGDYFWVFSAPKSSDRKQKNKAIV